MTGKRLSRVMKALYIFELNDDFTRVEFEILHLRRRRTPDTYESECCFIDATCDCTAYYNNGDSKCVVNMNDVIEVVRNVHYLHTSLRKVQYTKRRGTYFLKYLKDYTDIRIRALHRYARCL